MTTRAQQLKTETSKFLAQSLNDERYPDMVLGDVLGPEDVEDEIIALIATLGNQKGAVK